MKLSIAVLSVCALALTACSHTPANQAAPQAQEVSDAEANARPAVPELVNTPIDELQRREAAGDIKAQVELASRYGLGKGVERDYAKATALFRSAAERNDPVAQYLLGTAYYHGAGVQKDEAQAALWFERAAQQNFGEAQYQLAVMIIAGKGGMSPSWEGAIPLLWRAAVQDYGRAAYLLGFAYERGKGVDRNFKAAAYWYRYANREAIHAQALFNLALLIKNGQVEPQPGDPRPDILLREAEERLAAKEAAEKAKQPAGSTEP